MVELVCKAFRIISRCRNPTSGGGALIESGIEQQEDWYVVGRISCCCSSPYEGRFIGDGLDVGFP